MKCTKCSSKMEEKKGETPEGVSYTYYSCTSCGEEIVDMKQLHSVAQKYRELKRYVVKISKWGDSIAIRIPKELAKEYGLKPNKQANLIPEKEAIKITA